MGENGLITLEKVGIRPTSQ